MYIVSDSIKNIARTSFVYTFKKVRARKAQKSYTLTFFVTNDAKRNQKKQRCPRPGPYKNRNPSTTATPCLCSQPPTPAHSCLTGTPTLLNSAIGVAVSGREQGVKLTSGRKTDTNDVPENVRALAVFLAKLCSFQ